MTGSKRPSIAIIGCKGLPATYGIDRVVENYIQHLKNDFDFTIYCSAEYTDRPDGDYDGYHQITLKKIRNRRLNTLWYYIKAGMHMLFRGHYDLIHMHHSDAAFLIPLLRLKYGRKLIVTTHGSFMPMHLNDKWKHFTPYFWVQVHIFLRFAPVLTNVSKEEQKSCLKVLGKNSAYIPNGINPDEPVSDKDVGQGYIFFAAGRIMKLKGLDVLLEALHKIGFKGKLLVAGDTSHAPEKYLKELHELSEGLDVQYLGMITDSSLLFKYAKQSLFFVFPTRKEAMSMQLLEVASLKVPVIASDIEANTNVFAGDEVLFFRSGDSADLAEKIHFAIENPDRMRAYAEKALETLSQYYIWSKIAGQYKNVYHKTLEE